MHRRTILLSREKSLLPAMQVFVEAKRNYNEASAAVKALLPQYQAMYKEYQNLIAQSRVASNNYYLKTFGKVK
jgi:DNA-binding ferritin-like protein (Dps family)